MDDVELVALRTFLREWNLNDIVDDSVTALKFDFESSIVAFTSDECSSPGSCVADPMSEDDDMKPMPPKKMTLKEIKRERQKVYDRKSTAKRKAKIEAASRAFVAGLKLLNALLEDRIQRTRRVTVTMRLVHLRRDEQTFPDHDHDRRMVDQKAQTQLTLNNAAMKYVDLCTSTWALSKLENGKFFLKKFVAGIEFNVDGLSTLRQKLTESTAELEWCMLRKPSRVWV